MHYFVIDTIASSTPFNPSNRARYSPAFNDAGSPTASVHLILLSALLKRETNLPVHRKKRLIAVSGIFENQGTNLRRITATEMI